MSAAAEASAGRPLQSLPSGWTWARLGDICDAVNGRAFKSSEWRESGLPIVRIQNLKDPEAESNYFVGELDERHRVRHGDLLFAWSGTPGTSFGAHIWKGPDAALNQHIFNIKFDSDVLDSRYFRLALNQNVSRYVAQAQGGVGLAHITKSKFLDSYIPLAPKAKQLDLVAEVEKQFSRLDEAVANLKRVKANLKRYKAAVLKAAIEGRLVPTEAELARRQRRSYEDGKTLLDRVQRERRSDWTGKATYCEPAEAADPWAPGLAEGWVLASLEALTSANRVICYGILMPKENVSDGVLYVKVRDMKDDTIDVASLYRTSAGIAAKYSRASLRTGDVLLSIRGTYGRVALVPPVLNGGNITQDTARLAISPSVCKEFVVVYLRSEHAQRYFKAVARGVAVKGVNIGDVRPMPVPVPPIFEQRRIADEVDRRLSLVREVEVEVEWNLSRAMALRAKALESFFACGI